MKWMKERDLLIAQTMAFVQSVTGKKPDPEQWAAAPKAEKSNFAPVAPLPATAVPVPEAVPALAEPARPFPQPSFAKLDIRGDFQSEVKARVASFRAHQERFIREREEYSSTTMAKVRASLRDDEPTRPAK